MRLRHARGWLVALAVIVAGAIGWAAPARSAQDVAANEGRPVVHIGVLAYQGEPQARQEWAPLARYLAQALPRHRFAFDYLGLDALRQAVADGALDFVLTNPGQYVALEAAHGVSRIATLEHGASPVSNLAVAAAVVVLQARADLQHLADLRGRALAATSAEGFGGYQIVWRELAAQGIDPERDLKARHFTGFPMQRALEAVDAGQADAAILRACMLEGVPDWRQRYKVLSGRFEPVLGCTVSSRLYPNWPLASLRQTPAELARTLAIALLRMEPGEHGIGWTAPADYQGIHEVFRELRIGPYEHLRATSLPALARRWWPAGLALAAALLLWLAYTLHVKHLVRSRTAALERALREREAFEARMRRQQEQADHLARLSVLGEMSSTLAHELAQPLAGVGNYAQSLLRRLDNGRLTDDAVREAATGIAAQAKAAAGTLKRIKGFARKRASAREAQPLPALVALAHEAVALFRGMQMSSPNIDVADALPAHAQGMQVSIDPQQVQQILLNLLKNAQDAMQGLPPQAQRIGVTVAAEDGWAVLRVRDQGEGLDDAQMQRLFEPFYTSKEDGLGLGLSICQSIAEAHGGQLRGERADNGGGMVFSLSLPIHEHPARPHDSSGR